MPNIRMKYTELRSRTLSRTGDAINTLQHKCDSGEANIRSNSGTHTHRQPIRLMAKRQYACKSFARLLCFFFLTLSWLCSARSHSHKNADSKNRSLSLRSNIIEVLLAFRHPSMAQTKRGSDIILRNYFSETKRVSDARIESRT